MLRYIPLDRVGEFEQVLWDAVGSPLVTRRRDAIGALLGLHGLRVGEVSRALAEDFSPAARTLHVRTLKGGERRTLPLDQSLVEAIVSWRHEMRLHPNKGPILVTRKNKPVATTAYRRFVAAVTQRLFGEPFRFHALRHTFAMKILTNDESDPRDALLLVKQYLGHKSLSSTQEYLSALSKLPASCIPARDRPYMRPCLGGLQLRLFQPETG